MSPAEADDVARDAAIAPAPGPAAAGGTEALAAQIAAGRLGPNEAVRDVIDRMVDGMVDDMLGAGGPGVTAADRDELRALLADLVANDPHLAHLIGRI